MTWKSKASKRTILSTFGAEASAWRDALDLAEYTRAMLCEVLIWARVLPDCLAKDASLHEDRGTALTVASLRERCSAGVGGDIKRSGLMWVPTRVQLANEIIGWSLLEKRSHIWNRLASRREYKSPEAETTHRQSERSSRRLSCPNGS